jgi:uncharacterized integral membrane protein
MTSTQIDEENPAMARRRDHEPLQVERTRISSTWAAVAVAVVFLVLLIIFIAQNNRRVPIHFLGANGRVSEAVALIAAAVAGAVLVLAVSAARILQLRIAGRRHNRAVKRDIKQEAAETKAAAAAPAAVAEPAVPGTGAEPADATTPPDSAAAPVGEPHAVQP